MADETYDNVVIGSGEAGKFLAWALARQGQRTAVVEWHRNVGGACPNVACLPTKNLIHSAKVADLARRAGEFGVRPSGSPASSGTPGTPGTFSSPISSGVAVDIAGVIGRKRAMVDGLQAVHLNNFRDSGAEVVVGRGWFDGPRVVRVALRDADGRTTGEERVLRGERVFLNVGTRADVPGIPGLADARPMRHVEALEIDHLPAHLVVLGGGHVAMEFAQAFRRLGSRVTVVHRGGRLLGREDADVSEAVAGLMADEGVEVRLGTAVRRVSGTSGDRVRLELDAGSGSAESLDATDLLVATGRVPNTDTFDAVRGGVELDARGYVRVDEQLRTTAPGIWAMGECAGSPGFTHASFDDFRVVRDNLGGKPRSTAGRLVPYCLFTDPELAHVGLSETEAAARGVPYRLAKIPAAAVLRTWTLSAKRGFLKALVGPAGDDRILGFTAFAAEASELLAAVQTAMMGNLPYTALRDGIYAHPTMAEGLTVLFAKDPQPRPA